MPLLQIVSTNFFIIAIVMQHVAASYKLSTEFCLVWNGVYYDFMINGSIMLCFLSLSLPLFLFLSIVTMCHVARFYRSMIMLLRSFRLDAGKNIYIFIGNVKRHKFLEVDVADGDTLSVRRVFFSANDTALVLD